MKLNGLFRDQKDFADLPIRLALLAPPEAFNFLVSQARGRRAAPRLSFIANKATRWHRKVDPPRAGTPRFSRGNDCSRPPPWGKRLFNY